MFAEGSLMISLLAAHPGENFRQVLPFVLVGAAILLLLYVLQAALRRRNEAKSRWSAWEKLVYLMILISVTVLAVTAFYPLLRHQRMASWSLFAHMVGAGMFVFTLPVLALTWCEPNRLDLRPPVGQRGGAAPRRFYGVPKLLFWLLLASGLIVSMTMLISMLPMFGTLGLQSLLDIHRFTGLVVVLALLFHLICVLLQRVGWR